MTKDVLLLLGHYDRDQVNDGIKVPEYLTAPDGRLFQILSWKPTVAPKAVVTATVEVQISVPFSQPDVSSASQQVQTSPVESRGDESETKA